MKRQLPAYVYTRKGGLLYFERRGWQSVRIHSEPGTPEFAAEYARILQGAQIITTKRNFTALVTAYRSSTEFKRLAPRTASDYDKVLDWVIAKLGPLPVAAMRQKDVYAAQGRNADKVRFANYIVQVLRVLFKFAMKHGWRDDNPAKGVPMLTSGTEGREPWPVKLLDAYRANAEGLDLLLFELCIGTGQRIGDVLRMRWADVEDGGIWVRQGKTKARLWIPFTTRLAAILEATPRIGLTIAAWGKHGKPVTYRAAADRIMAVRKIIGAERFDIHSLRYTAAAELAALGLDDATIASITGHQTMKMIARYAGPSRQIARAKIAQERRN